MGGVPGTARFMSYPGSRDSAVNGRSGILAKETKK